MQTVKVRLRKPTRVFTFISKDVPLRRNEACVVRSDRGLEYGVCVTNSEDCAEEVQERIKMSVVRKATHNDESTYRQIELDEERAMEICTQKIREHNLPMKLVDVEYTFDKHKVVFYFTAADRVDFRRLVRDLAQSLRTRIELRHIQVRDEAKLVGGLGMCGRALCCSTWLREFHPISMKMAKRQNLSLNPAKISGQCGRLLCCLSYEDHHYPKRKKPKPAPVEGEERPEEPETEEEVVDALPSVRTKDTLDLSVPGDFGRAVEDDEEDTPAAVVEGLGGEEPEIDSSAVSDKKESSEARPPRPQGDGDGEPQRRSSRRRRRRRRPKSGPSGDSSNKSS